MSNDLLFDAIGGVAADWRDRKLNIPLRYFEAQSFTVTFRVPVSVVEGLLPANVHPLRWGRREAITVVVFNDFLKSDIGDYREILVGFPVSVGEKLWPYAGLRSFSRKGGAIFTYDMTLDDQTAIDLGVDIAGYPKHMGELDFDLASSTIRCVWREDGEDVLRVAAPRPSSTPIDERDRLDLITIKDGYVLRSQSVGYTGRAGRADGSAISIEYGTGLRAESIRNLTRGKCLGGRLALGRQLTLSPPLEAWTPGP